MTITDISQTLHLNRNSVAKYLEILVTSGHVEKQPIGRAKLYSLSQRIPISAMLNLSSDMILILDEESKIWYANDNLLAFERKESCRDHRKEPDRGNPPDLLGPRGPVHASRNPGRAGIPERGGYRTGRWIPRSLPSPSYPPSLRTDRRGITVIAEDITERKKAEENLREHLHFLQELIDRIPTPVFYKDLTGHYLGCNRAFEDYTRRPHDEILDRTAFDVLPAGSRKPVRCNGFHRPRDIPNANLSNP